MKRHTGFLGKSNLTRALHLTGATFVIVVNIFVFGSDFVAQNFNRIPAFEKFFLHVSGEHHVNQSPFELKMHFAINPAPLMEPSSDKPMIDFQRISTAFVAVSFIMVVLFFISILLLREDSKRTLFIPAIISPPPKRF